MILVKIPHFAFAEIKYVINFYFEETLSSPYKIQKSYDSNDTLLEIDNKKIIFKNSFFKNINDFQRHYTIQNINQKSEKYRLEINNKAFSIHTIYGENKLMVEEDKVTIFPDIIASTFFMLSRWEESLYEEKDSHQRFDTKYSYAYKNRLIQTPIVDEYVYFLNEIFCLIGISLPMKKKSFSSIIATHDIDKYQYINNWKEDFKKKIKYTFFKKSKEEKKIIKYLNQDPYNTFGLLMEKSEKIGNKAIFFFLVGNTSKQDLLYFNKETIKKVSENILSRGHEIGLHSSYKSFENKALIQQEKDVLESIIGKNINKARNHYLRVSYPNYWQVLSDNHIKYDYTMGYADELGFRAGTSRSYRAFDFEKRMEIDVVVQPLLTMDVTGKQYKKYSPEKFKKEVKKIKALCKKYAGSYCFLWHNSSFFIDGWQRHHCVFEEMYNIK